MAVPEYKVEAAAKAMAAKLPGWKQGPSVRADIITILEAAYAAKEPAPEPVEEVVPVTGEMMDAGIAAYLDESSRVIPHERAKVTRCGLEAAYRAMHRARPSVGPVDAPHGAELSDEAVRAAVEAYRNQVPGRGYEADLRDVLTAALPYLTGRKAREFTAEHKRRLPDMPNAYAYFPNERSGKDRRCGWNDGTWPPHTRRKRFGDRRKVSP